MESETLLISSERVKTHADIEYFELRQPWLISTSSRKDNSSADPFILFYKLMTYRVYRASCWIRNRGNRWGIFPSMNYIDLTGWCLQLDLSQRLLAYHFCSAIRAQSLSLPYFLHSISTQLANYDVIGEQYRQLLSRQQGPPVR